ncbi:hypothetical protein H0H93_010906 [Arthromyces matolae]|nr:hypothetical protein H0H93_010906 [Arthromyces matolae]
MAPKSWATIEQDTYLNNHLSGFVNAKLTKKDSGSSKKLTRYTKEVIKGFFANWPEETALVHDGHLPQSVVDTPRSQWTPVEQKIMADAVKKRKEQITNWLRNHSTDAVGMKATGSRSSNVVLASLIKPPKRHRLHKAEEKYQTMFYTDKLRALVQAEWDKHGIKADAEEDETEEQEDKDESSGAPSSSVRSLKMTLQRRVVAAAWNAEVPQVKDAVFRAMEEEKAEMIRSLDMSKEGLDRDPEQRELVISNLVTLLENVSHEIHRLCGWCTTVITGGPNPSLNNAISVQTVTFGESPDTQTSFLGAYPQFNQLVSQPFLAWLRNVFPQHPVANLAQSSSPLASRSDNVTVATPTPNSETATSTPSVTSTNPNIIPSAPNFQLPTPTPIVTPSVSADPNIITPTPNFQLPTPTPMSMSSLSDPLVTLPFTQFSMYGPFQSSSELPSDTSNMSSTLQFPDTSNQSLEWNDSLTSFSGPFDIAISTPQSSTFLSSSIPAGSSSGFFFPSSMYPTTSAPFSNVSTGSVSIPNPTAASRDSSYEQPAGVPLTPLNIPTHSTAITSETVTTSNGSFIPNMYPTTSVPFSNVSTGSVSIPNPTAASRDSSYEQPASVPLTPLNIPTLSTAITSETATASNGSFTSIPNTTPGPTGTPSEPCFPTTRPSAPAHSRPPTVSVENQNKPADVEGASKPLRGRGRPKKNVEALITRQADQTSPIPRSSRRSVQAVEESVGLMTRASKRKSLESAQAQSKRRK